EIYQKKTQLEHILLRPDTYIGSVESVEQAMWIYDVKTSKMEQKVISYVPGLYKIFDEILVNAADNKIRDPSMSTVKVDISAQDPPTITVYNNGQGIPVEMHETEKVYIPELIFGHLLTSSNYDDAEQKVTGGRNGFGAKLCNIFSKRFTIETSDKSRGKRFKQVFTDNMSTAETPKFLKATKEDFTQVTFEPDLSKFGLTHLSDDFVALLRKRVVDVAGCVRDVKVFLNGERIKVKNFKEYCGLYLEEIQKPKPSMIYERINDRWEVCFTPSTDGQFHQVSFVNSIATSRGGTHVTYIAEQIVSYLVKLGSKKVKQTTIKPHQARSQLWVFVNCLIVNPAFDSQTKDTLTLRASFFGSKCILPDPYLTKVGKTGVLEEMLMQVRAKQDQALKKTDGGKRSRITGISKLEDANFAGTRRSRECTLILTEGDSAKSLAIAGLGKVGRD
ncbi:histidine kinase-like ATPase, partial [Piptocephalis cylindrospora]